MTPVIIAYNSVEIVTGLLMAGAGGEPSDAEEQLPLFQDVIVFRRQQSLTADSLI